MAENQNMCIYCESSMQDSRMFYCKSPGNPEPNAAYYKDGLFFRDDCRRADENGYSEGCVRFIKPVIPVICPQAGSNVPESSQGNGQSRRRARERLTYLSRMDADEQSDIRTVYAQPQQDDRSAEGQDSSLAGNLLKAGAKAAVDIGKSIVNPVGAGADFVADVAKSLIDEL